MNIDSNFIIRTRSLLFPFARGSEFSIESTPGEQPDALVLDKIYQEAQKGGGTYASLIRAIIQSDLVQKIQTEADNED